MTSIINASTTAGVIITPDTSGNLAFQSAGANVATLTASGLSFAAAPGQNPQNAPGKVIQVVSYTTSTNFSTSSSSFVATPITVSITPLFSTSKVFVSFSGGQIDIGNGRTQASLNLFRNTSPVVGGSYGLACVFLTGPSSFEMQVPAAMQYLDSPATTSSTSYTVYLASSSGGTVYMSTNANNMTITAMEIAA